MYSCKSLIHARIFLILFVLSATLAFQGCIIHSHGHPNVGYKTKTYSNKKYRQHPHKDTQTRQPNPEFVKKIPQKEQHPSNTRKPPAHARAHEVAKGRPFIENEHPSSRGKGPKVKKGKPDKVDGHPSQHARNNLHRNQKTDKHKSFKGDAHPSSQGKSHNKGLGKPEKDADHPSWNALDNRGPKNGKVKPLWGDELDSKHTQLDNKTYGKSHHNRQNQKGGYSKNEDHPSSEIEESSIENPGVNNKEKVQIAHAKPFPGKGKGSQTGKKSNHGQNKKQTDISAPETKEKPIPSAETPQPVTTTASYEPVVFDETQRTIIQSYYQMSGRKNSGKGKGKQSKKMKGKTSARMAINDILTKKTKSLPQKLESQLPPLPPNTQRVLYNQQVLLIEKGTNKILDVINLNN